MLHLAAGRGHAARRAGPHRRGHRPRLGVLQAGPLRTEIGRSRLQLPGEGECSVESDVKRMRRK